MGQKKLQSSGNGIPVRCFTSALWCFTKLEGFDKIAPHMQHTSLLVTFKMRMREMRVKTWMNEDMIQFTFSFTLKVC